MKPLTQADLLSHAEYESQRVSFRQDIIALKKRRRLAIGPLITVVFENRETIRFQVQEMIRAERIFDPAKIQEELDVYNTLLPGPGELSATLLIEITQDERIKEILDTFHGIDRPGTLSLVVQDEAISADFEVGHSNEEKISAVHFVRFSLPDHVQRKLWRPGVQACLKISHENYVAESDVPQALIQEWAKDLGA